LEDHIGYLTYFSYSIRRYQRQLKTILIIYLQIQISLLSHKKWGSDTPLFDYHSQQMALPASTQKIITALAALLQLGRDYQFVTHFETEGKIIDHRLKGDLVVRFTGDPT